MSFKTLLPPTILFAPSNEHPTCIQGLTRYDVTLGRGTSRNQHAGNVMFRSFIEAIFPHYDGIKEGKKHLFAKAAVDRIRENGRFVVLNENGFWEDAPYHKCIKKAQTLLRAYSLKEKRSLSPPSVPQPKNVVHPVSPTSVGVSPPSFDDLPLLSLPTIAFGESSACSSSTMGYDTIHVVPPSSVSVPLRQSMDAEDMFTHTFLRSMNDDDIVQSILQEPLDDAILDDIVMSLSDNDGDFFV